MIFKIGFNAFILLGLLQIFMNVDAQRSATQCGTCGDLSLATCVNERDYYFCPDGTNSVQPLQSCSETEYCSNVAGTCVDKATAVPDCTPCGVCPTVGNLPIQTCLSATEFTICVAGSPLNFPTACPDGQLCNTEVYKITGEICSPQCVLEFYGQSSSSCDNSAATTAAPPTAAPPSIADQQQLCRNLLAAGITGRFFYVLNSSDASCKSYIYCQPTSNNGMDTLYLTCDSGYFDQSKQGCVADRPSNCTAAVRNFFSL